MIACTMVNKYPWSYSQLSCSVHHVRGAHAASLSYVPYRRQCPLGTEETSFHTPWSSIFDSYGTWSINYILRNAISNCYPNQKHRCTWWLIVRTLLNLNLKINLQHNYNSYTYFNLILNHIKYASGVCWGRAPSQSKRMLIRLPTKNLNIVTLNY